MATRYLTPPAPKTAKPMKSSRAPKAKPTKYLINTTVLGKHKEIKQ